MEVNLVMERSPVFLTSGQRLVLVVMFMKLMEDTKVITRPNLVAQTRHQVGFQGAPLTVRSLQLRDCPSPRPRDSRPRPLGPGSQPCFTPLQVRTRSGPQQSPWMTWTGTPRAVQDTGGP